MQNKSIKQSLIILISLFTLISGVIIFVYLKTIGYFLGSILGMLNILFTLGVYSKYTSKLSIYGILTITIFEMIFVFKHGLLSFLPFLISIFFILILTINRGDKVKESNGEKTN
jgi:hypothetical protein